MIHIGETKKFIARDKSVLGTGDEPEVMGAEALGGQKQSGNYRVDGGRRVKRGTGTHLPARSAGKGTKTAQEKRDK